MYGINHIIYRNSSVIREKFMACFFFVPMEKQAKNCAECAIMLSLDSLNFHGNDHTKYGQWLKNTEI